MVGDDSCSNAPTGPGGVEVSSTMYFTRVVGCIRIPSDLMWRQVSKLLPLNAAFTLNTKKEAWTAQPCLDQLSHQPVSLRKQPLQKKMEAMTTVQSL